MEVKNPKKLLVIFGIFLVVGLYISIFVAFNQLVTNKYIVLVLGISISYFGVVGIYRTISSKRGN